MRLQEFQGKQLLLGHGIAITRGIIAEKANEAAAAARQLGRVGSSSKRNALRGTARRQAVCA